MRLNRFEVTGYKNLRRTVALEELAAINVIHGENNVGKSNLLQAINLFFFLLSQMATRGETVSTKTDLGEDETATAWLVIDGEARGVRFHVSQQTLHQDGFPADEIFNIEEPSPITLRGEVAITTDDWRFAGRSDAAEQVVHVTFGISRSHGGCVNVETRSGAGVFEPERWGHLREVASLVVHNFDVRSVEKSRGFILVDVHRRVASVDSSEAAEDMYKAVPLHLLLGLYDAKESVEPGIFQRWEAFERAMSSLGRIVGDGRFVITYNRVRGRAHLVVQKGRMRMPIESMGSGVQQIASLLARVLLANSAIVAVEEPELNLRYELQLRLRDMLRQIVESGLGPRQVILSSHSPAFETGDAFYAMTAADEGPRIERRPVSEATRFLQVELGVQLPSEQGAFGYVSSDGLLRLSEDVRRQLGVERGGGVVVLKRAAHPYVEMLTDEQFMSLLQGAENGK
jgi:predicted ATPase